MYATQRRSYRVRGYRCPRAPDKGAPKSVWILKFLFCVLCDLRFVTILQPTFCYAQSILLCEFNIAKPYIVWLLIFHGGRKIWFLSPGAKHTTQLRLCPQEIVSYSSARQLTECSMRARSRPSHRNWISVEMLNQRVVLLQLRSRSPLRSLKSTSDFLVVVSSNTKSAHGSSGPVVLWSDGALLKHTGPAFCLVKFRWIGWYECS